jgi:Mg2+ and Co2+ transporter CorA
MKLELQKNIALQLLINKHAGEDVTADLIQKISDKFDAIESELEKRHEKKDKISEAERLEKLQTLENNFCL